MRQRDTKEQGGRDDRENNGTETERCEGRQDEGQNRVRARKKTVNRQRDKGNCRAGGANDDFQCLWASARIGEDGLKESRGGGRTPASVVQAFIWIVMRGEGARQDQGFSLRQIEENNPEPPLGIVGPLVSGLSRLPLATNNPEN